MDFTEKTIQRDVKYSGRIFTVTQDIVELPNGKLLHVTLCSTQEQ